MNRVASSLALLGSALLAGSLEAGAGALRVHPTQVRLSAKVSSGLVQITNDSDDRLHFQLSLFEWAQSVEGQMELRPSKDVLFFPPLLALGPREARNVRVGLATTPGAVEKTYRLFLEELPDAQAEGSGIRVLRRLGIPIFVQPARATAEGRIDVASTGEGQLRFLVRNTGNVHFVPRAVRVQALAADDRVVVTENMNGWYILAGGARQYDFRLAPELCGAVETVAIEVEVGASVIRRHLNGSAELCRP